MDEQEAASLAIRASAAVAAGGAGLANPVAGLIAAGLVPAVETAITLWQAHQAQNVEEALDVAMETAKLAADVMIERLCADTTRLVFLSEALTAAARSTFSERTRALGHSLASGALAQDTAAVDEERAWVGLLAELEAPHVRMLRHLVPWPNEDEAHRGTLGVAAAGGVRNLELARAMLAKLDGLGLVYKTWLPHGTLGPEKPPEGWFPQPLGLEVLRRLEAAGVSSARP